MRNDVADHSDPYSSYVLHKLLIQNVVVEKASDIKTYHER